MANESKQFLLKFNIKILGVQRICCTDFSFRYSDFKIEIRAMAEFLEQISQLFFYSVNKM